ncbi:MAG: hypothetical protein V1817_03210 [Candidatus Micrarchaeota archaeon]
MKLFKATAFLVVICLALVLAGCAQTQQPQTLQPSGSAGSASVAPTAAPTQTALEPSLTAAQQQGGSENEDGEFVFDLPDGSEGQTGANGLDSSLDSFG